MTPVLSPERRDEFESLLRPVLPFAFRYAYRLTSDREVSMDLVQDTSVAAFRSFDQYTEGTNFKAWFLKILMRRFFRTKERSRREPIVSLEETPELFLYQKAKSLGLSMQDDPVSKLLERFEGDAIGDALAGLPEDYRVVATLHYLGDVSYEECAQMLGVPIGTVRSRLHRARKSLQLALWRIGEERGYVPQEIG